MTDMQIRKEGCRALVDALGHVDAKRFVALIQRERFDYTEWRRALWPDKTVDQVSQAARDRRRRQSPRDDRE